MAKQTIMVVDDSIVTRQIIKNALIKADYDVILAKNGMEALAKLEWEDIIPDLIALDIDMPKMNGFETCRKIRSQAESTNEQKRLVANKPIIFISANNTLENREKGYELEVLDFIDKPITPEIVTNTINNILRAHDQFVSMSALVVDDSPFSRRIVCNILARHGLKIHEASNGDEALDVLKKVNFDIDIIITDYIMPGLSGKKLCRLLRSFEALEQVPVIFISSVDTKETTLSFFKVGANDYISKPFLEEEFQARVLTQLRNRKHVKQLELLNEQLQSLNEQLQHVAEHDGLTGIHNRGYFQKKLAVDFAHNKQTGGQLCCILIDLDYFKKVNDTYGHTFGDFVLIEFAKILGRSRRESDIVARYGGEEFVLLLPDLDIAEAKSTAEKLREAAERHTYYDGKSKLQVTISVGVASLQDHQPENPDKFLSMADEALYQAKENGRNRVEVY